MTKKIHFIGIGGIGMSALARFALQSDYKVSGSDINASEITTSLVKEGVTFFNEHNAKKYTRL
jgi:UDP-N-acetylmuramate--alanine ligase